MKRLLVFILMTMMLFADTLHADVIFPPEKGLLDFFVDLVVGRETPILDLTSYVVWGGVGVVGSFLNESLFWDTEIAMELRGYFRVRSYRGFFLSWYSGMAIMNNFGDLFDLGVVPGMKLNSKIYTKNTLALEPYIGLSIPVVYKLNESGEHFSFPLLTVGIMLCFIKLVP